MLGDVTLVDDPAEADYAILMLNPKSGAYFSATEGYLELDICEDKEVLNVFCIVDWSCCTSHSDITAQNNFLACMQ